MHRVKAQRIVAEDQSTFGGKRVGGPFTKFTQFGTVFGAESLAQAAARRPARSSRRR